MNLHIVVISFHKATRLHIIIHTSDYQVEGAKYYTVYDRIDATATINFSTQFGAATIQERRLFRSARVQAEKISEKVNTSTRIVYYWRPRSSPSPFGRACEHRRLRSI